jgi:hypothetical protein
VSFCFLSPANFLFAGPLQETPLQETPLGMRCGQFFFGIYVFAVPPQKSAEFETAIRRVG